MFTAVTNNVVTMIISQDMTGVLGSGDDEDTGQWIMLTLTGSEQQPLTPALTTVTETQRERGWSSSQADCLLQPSRVA